MSIAELWQRAYIEALRNGKGSVCAEGEADWAVRAFKARFEWEMVDIETYGWREREMAKPVASST